MLENQAMEQTSGIPPLESFMCVFYDKQHDSQFSLLLIFSFFRMLVHFLYYIFLGVVGIRCSYPVLGYPYISIDFSFVIQLCCKAM